MLRIWAKQAARFDGISFDAFSLLQDGLPATETDIGRSEVVQVLMVAPADLMVDEGVDLLL